VPFIQILSHDTEFLTNVSPPVNLVHCSVCIPRWLFPIWVLTILVQLFCDISPYSCWESTLRWATIVFFQTCTYACRIWGSHSGGYEEFCHIQRCVVRLKSTDVSEEHIASIFRLCLLPASPRCLAWLILQTWRWRRHVPPKRQLTFNGTLHDIPVDRILLSLYFLYFTHLK
jgi:hypothetical protein